MVCSIILLEYLFPNFHNTSTGKQMSKIVKFINNPKYL